MDTNKVIYMNEADKTISIPPEVQHGTLKSNGSDGGEPPMRNNYVTKEEFSKSIDSINHKIDLLDTHLDTTFQQVNTKLEKQKVWFYGTGIAIVAAIISFISFLK